MTSTKPDSSPVLKSGTTHLRYLKKNKKGKSYLESSSHWLLLGKKAGCLRYMLNWQRLHTNTVAAEEGEIFGVSKRKGTLHLSSVNKGRQKQRIKHKLHFGKPYLA